ncbi:MAG: DUF3459 domain-containing protein [Chloroflexi bacterium]|nr:DUF3459 domain-containing protein [Chloroflexota bacterium]
MRTHTVVVCLILLSLVVACRAPVAEERAPLVVAPVGLDGALLVSDDAGPWWRDTTFYEVFVRSYRDSDGDGIGDLNGLIERLDYLNDGDPATSTDLGITGLWLMPIMASPSYHGYDVTDYYAVRPEYGTNEDFLRLMDEAHRRGIRVIVDLVLNHTSSHHPWFVEAQNPQSDKRDWYLWSATQPSGKGWHAGANGGYYYGQFWSEMPDLNYGNPAVTEAMNAVVRYWLTEMRVDGFRLDAIKFLYEDGARIEHVPATHDWLKAFRSMYTRVAPHAYTVGEVVADADTSARYVDGELDAVFDFALADATLKSAQGGARDDALRAQQYALQAYPPGTLATFLANHDQNRARTRLLHDDQAKTAASLQLTFGGTPFIYYGEEIGMEGRKPDEDIRRPMQWTPDGGFGTGTSWHPYYEDYATRNVALQAADPLSILSHYRALLRVRNEHEALRVGEWQPIEAGPAAVYASLRWTEREHILVLINLSSSPVSDYALTLDSGPLTRRMQPALLLGEATTLRAPRISAAGGFKNYQPIESLPPRSTWILQLQP